VGRKSVWAGIALVVVLAVVLFAVARRGRDDGDDIHAVQLPDRPPALTGTAYGVVLTVPCRRNCVTGVAQVRVGRAGSLHMLLEGGVNDIASNGHDVLALHTNGASYQIVDARTRNVIANGFGYAVAFDEFPDGRLAVLVHDDDSNTRVDVIDPNTAAARTISLSTHVPNAVAVEGGRIAVLHDFDLDDRGVTVIEPTGGRHEVHLDALGGGDGPVMFGHVELTWGGSGMFAISASHPFPSSQGSPPPWKAWTLVVDDAGTIVARLDGWQGLAWSPDGLGLLVGRKPRPIETERNFELRVRYGPGLRRSERVTTERLPISLVAWAN
jgi:hypothetical protein